ncbi:MULTISPECIES: penicillin-binding protein 1C [unclassified Lentimicrobium]|uniref:penicillin-binding protein 1C n=1 Tax=unclassified Lentimicrobium TaxID=2677434 RepID=UPI001554F008|nr:MULTISPECIES: penicillin-binding protein 1C [unclassified Lentimicrobium]NPD47253.1 penicillin-binding protein 1C [Lentimicrobium sp. S6]NPD86764.1 penicillin-binding protein 1C [Lentimicrobium sp. L6]
MREQLEKYKYYLLGGLVLTLVLWFYFLIPKPLFQEPYSTILNDRHGRLLSARIADDGQWRFPMSDSLPDKFVQCITFFEDEYFYQHPGVNPFSLFRAFRQNLEAGSIVSGGSTLSMQTIRLARKAKTRSLWQKTIEVFWSIRMELSYSKDEVLRLYAAHAPFGGNVVGLETAAWRYYGRSPYLLSWGEMATLAVLPNAPSLIYPGKNQEKLFHKRNRLLDKLQRNGIIDQETCDLAKSEAIVSKAKSVKSQAPHLLDRLISEGEKGERIQSTVDKELQNKLSRLVADYHSIYSQNEIHNMAALVLDVRNSEVLAYVGNTECEEEGCGRDVDIIQAPRSTGSVLKPFLYAFMLEDGFLLPKSLVEDIPTQISGYSPRNFEESYDGMVPADEALARSLNIPAVRNLQHYGLERFSTHLKKLDLHHINKSSSHYGLSVILGGAESSLWDLSNAYMRMAQRLNDNGSDFPAHFDLNEKHQRIAEDDAFNVGALWWTAEALSQVKRPWQESGWQEFQSAKNIAWKTGTSFGHRDAWAIGFTPDYVVAVWVGNADGEGRPGLTGLSMAAPVMFKVFNSLPRGEWFEQPDWDLIPQKVCARSGYLAADACEEVEELMLPKKSVNTKVCPFHQIIHLDKNEQFRVTSSCYSVSEMKSKSWFVLPPIPEWYYKKNNPFYQSLPPFKSDCLQSSKNEMDIIYPKNYTKILIPRELDGSKGKVVFEVVHRQSNQIIYWHLDQEYLGQSIGQHRMELDTEAGKHQMTIMDENGEVLEWRFEVVE